MWRLVILVIVLAVIIALAWAYSYFWSSGKANLPVTQENTITDEERAAIAGKPSGIPLQNPDLTDEERAAIAGKPVELK